MIIQTSFKLIYHMAYTNAYIYYTETQHYMTDGNILTGVSNGYS